MPKYLSFLLTLFVFFGSTAQECSKRSVYFRSDKHNLKKHEKATIDSLIQKLDPEKHYLVELYAYTDSSNTMIYNYQLSGKRNRSVRDYIQSIRPKNIVFLTRNLGEKASGNLQENRRVDIYTYPLDDKDRILVQSEIGVKAWISYRNFSSCGYCLKQKPTLDTYFTEEKDAKMLNLKMKQDCSVNADFKCDTAEFRIPFELFNSSASIKNIKNVYPYLRNKWEKRTNEDLKIDSVFTITYDTVSREYVIRYDCYNMYYDFILLDIHIIFCPYVQFVFPENIDKIKTAVSYLDKPRDYEFPLAFHDAGIPGTRKEIQPQPIPERKKERWYLRYSDVYVLEKNCPGFEIFSHGIRDRNRVFAKFTLDDLREIDKIVRSIQYIDGNNKPQSFLRIDIPDELYKPLKYTNIRIKLKTPKHTVLDSAGIFLEPYDFFIPIKKVKKNQYEALMPEMEFDMAVYSGNKETVIPFQKIRKHYRKRKYILRMKIRNRNLSQ